jgi:hypothetical protein
MADKFLNSLIQKSKDTRKLFLATSELHNISTCYHNSNDKIVNEILEIGMVSVPIQYLFVISTTPNKVPNKTLDVDVHVKSFLSIDLKFVPTETTLNQSIHVKPNYPKNVVDIVFRRLFGIFDNESNQLQTDFNVFNDKIHIQDITALKKYKDDFTISSHKEEYTTKMKTTNSSFHISFRTFMYNGNKYIDNILVKIIGSTHTQTPTPSIHEKAFH